MHRTNHRKSGRSSLLNIVTAVLVCHPALAAEAGLGAYVGMHGDRLVEDLGEPGMRTPHELWYWRGPSVAGGQPGAPNPAVRNGRNGVIVNGAGGDYAPLSFAEDFCNIVVKLDDKGVVDAIERQGPGCFEFIHRLRQTARAHSP
jgi:hypothetical protein